MAKTRYQKAVEVLKELKENEGEFVQLNSLLNAVRKDIGGHEERTVKPYLKFMLDMNLIISTEKGLLIKC